MGAIIGGYLENIGVLGLIIESAGNPHHPRGAVYRELSSWVAGEGITVDSVGAHVSITGGDLKDRGANGDVFRDTRVLEMLREHWWFVIDVSNFDVHDGYS